MRNLQARSEIPLALSTGSPPLLAAARHRRSGAVAAVVLLLGSGMALIGSETSASANDQVCSGLDSGKIDVSGSTKTVTVTAPDGYSITGYCVKAGSVQQGNGPHYVTLSSQRTVTFGHPSGKDVSHYSVSYAAEPQRADTYRDVPRRLENCEIAGVRTWTDRYTTTYKWDGTKFVGTETGPVRVSETFVAYTDAEYQSKCAPAQPPAITRVVHFSEDNCVIGGYRTWTDTYTTPYVWNSQTKMWEKGTESGPVTSAKTFTAYTDSEYAVKCAGPIPADKVVTTEWVDGKWKCGDIRVTQTRTVTTTPYVWNAATKQWVEGTPSAKTETRVRPLTGNEATNCNPPAPNLPVDTDACPNMPGLQPAGTNCNAVVKGKKPYAKIVTRCTGVTKLVLVNRRSETVSFTLHGRGFHKVVRVKADTTRTVRTDLPNNTRAWVKVEGRTFSARVPGRCFLAAPSSVGSGV